ncbi:hypothetical protein RB597_008493 [Gaeumannomyces tritici]
MAASVRSEPEPKFDKATSKASSVPPNDSKNRASGSLGNEYYYSPLSHGSIRLLRLMPHKNKEAPIRCQLFEYPLQELGQGIHLYEALSYVWGSEENKQPIYVQLNDKSGGSSATPSTGNDYYLLITANLHEALSYLRDRVLERVIWIDAICINQENNDEKKEQVQSMAKIYANASCVIVWLGKAASDSDQAFEALRRAAGGRRAPPAIDEPTQQAILTLLERPWFQRIWVLQEVAAARYILIKCGFSAVDGYTFCSGLGKSKLSYDTHPALRDLIPPITYLIRNAVFRPQYETSLPETNLPSTFSLNIRPLGELVDMFHTRKATNPLDKVYALLGMSSDNPRDLKTAGLYEADYTASWAEVFRKLIQFSLSNQMSVDTWNERAMAVVRGKGYILGKVSSVNPQGDAQSISIVWKNSLGSFDISPKEITLQHSVQPIFEGDAVCLLQGASKPTIVRPRDCYSAIIIIAAPLTVTNSESPDHLRPITSPIDFVLIWNWNASQRKPQDRGYKSFISRPGGPQRPWTEWQDYLDKTTRLWNFGVLLNGMERYEDAGENLQKAVEVYGTALRSIGDDPGHSAWIETDGETLKVIHDLVIGAANDAKSFNDQTPLSWAAGNGHEAVARLLIEMGADIEAKSSDGGYTPLHQAAQNGHEAVARLLIEMGADIEAKSSDGGYTPLHQAAQNGHEAVARLLAELGADIEAKSGDGGYTPLHYAAQNGHEAVARLLAELSADIEAKDHRGYTPLHYATLNGHEAVARLLAELGADIKAKDHGGYTPLHYATLNGREAVARLLIEKGAGIKA